MWGVWLLFILLNFRWPPFIQFETYKKCSSPYHCLSFGLCAFVAHYPWWSEEPSGIFTWEQMLWLFKSFSSHRCSKSLSLHWMKDLFSAAIFLTTWGPGIVLIALRLGIVLMTFIGLKRIGVQNRSHHIGCWNRTQHVSRSCWKNSCDFFREILKGREKMQMGKVASWSIPFSVSHRSLWNPTLQIGSRLVGFHTG